MTVTVQWETFATRQNMLLQEHGGIMGAAICCAENGGDDTDDWTTCNRDRSFLLDRSEPALAGSNCTSSRGACLHPEKSCSASVTHCDKCEKHRHQKHEQDCDPNATGALACYGVTCIVDISQ